MNCIFGNRRKFTAKQYGKMSTPTYVMFGRSAKKYCIQAMSPQPTSRTEWISGNRAKTWFSALMANLAMGFQGSGLHRPRALNPFIKLDSYIWPRASNFFCRCRVSGLHSAATAMSHSNAKSMGNFRASRSRFFKREPSSTPSISEAALMHSLPGLSGLPWTMHGNWRTISSPNLFMTSLHISTSEQETCTLYLTTKSSGMVSTCWVAGHLWQVTGKRCGAKNPWHCAAPREASMPMVCSSSMTGTKKLSQNPHSPLNCFDNGVSWVICRARMTKNMSRPTLGSCMASPSHLRLVSEPRRKTTISSQCSRGAAKAQTVRRPK
mmetsp:Transcript_60798/g.157139  ORF Transcript_60798/g.157139 Transcript_60798/m.157139 type:complete len:322 (+) Transcript_60798:1351-2316(+)